MQNYCLISNQSGLLNRTDIKDPKDFYKKQSLFKEESLYVAKVLQGLVGILFYNFAMKKMNFSITFFGLMHIKDMVTDLEDTLAELGLSFISLLKNILLAGLYMMWIIFIIHFLFSLPLISGAQLGFENPL